MATVRFGMVSWDGTKYAPIAGGSITVQGLGTFPADNTVYDAGLGGTPHTLPPGTYAFTANPPSGYSLGNYATASYSIPQPEIWLPVPFFGMGGVSWPSGGRDGDNPFYISATNTNPTQITIMDSGNFLPNVQWYVPFNGNVWVFLTPSGGGGGGTTTYNCVNGQCVSVAGSGGQYATLAACQGACTPPPLPTACSPTQFLIFDQCVDKNTVYVTGGLVAVTVAALALMWHRKS